MASGKITGLGGAAGKITGVAGAAGKITGVGGAAGCVAGLHQIKMHFPRTTHFLLKVLNSIEWSSKCIEQTQQTYSWCSEVVNFYFVVVNFVS